ncbi:MAG TPA: thioredoxin domain-containing protein [Gemmatimonadales bacterium]|jgi:protein-disulfide isomerase
MTLATPVGARDHVQGSASARVTLLEYGDYECPGCGRAYPIIKAVQKAFGPNLRFVFRHFPLVTSHPHAVKAAEAAEAADAQGKFWAMHDRLFEHQDALDDMDLRRHARKIGLDLERFEQDLRGQALQARVRSDAEEGLRSGVNGTPTLFINGVGYSGKLEREALVLALARAALKAAPPVPA